MIDDFIRPYPGEDEVAFIKRQAYYYRIVLPRLRYGEQGIIKKLNHNKPISPSEKEGIESMWLKFLTPPQLDTLIDFRYYEMYNTVLHDGETLSRYIPDTFFYCFIDDYYTNPQHSNPVDDKNLYDMYFHDVNRPKTIFRKMDELFLDENYNEISYAEVLRRLTRSEEVILKKCKFSSGGKDIMFFRSSDDDTLLKEYLRNVPNVVGQEVIKQHAELSRLNPSSVNTVRIMTFLMHNHVHVLSSVMRMGIDGSRVDNASSGGIVCGLKPNGKLKEVAFDTSATMYMKHPKGTCFESVTVPNYTQCVDIAISLAKRFSSITKLISWDFAIDEKGQPLLLEFNLTWGELDFHQLCNGPILGDLTEEVLKDVFANSYTLNSILKSF